MPAEPSLPGAETVFTPFPRETSISPRTTVVSIRESDIVEWSLVEYLLRSAPPRTSTRPVVEFLGDHGRGGPMPWISVMAVTMSTSVAKVVTGVPVPRAVLDTAPSAVGRHVPSKSPPPP